MVAIAPSILAADFGNLRSEILALDKAGADMIHIDVMDGHYVPNLTFGPGIVRQIRPYTNLPFDVHLMVDNPETMVNWFIPVGADIVTVHAETCKHLDALLNTIRERGCKAGVSLNPSTPESVLQYVLDKVDQILVMTVNPGFGGQSFISAQLPKIARIKSMIGSRNIKIEVDGGINPLTAAECIAAGADILVAVGRGGFFGGRDPPFSTAATIAKTLML